MSQDDQLGDNPMSQDDQLVTVIMPNGDRHTAIGSPWIIYGLLRDGKEVCCGSGETEHILRLAPGFPFALRYSESDE